MMICTSVFMGDDKHLMSTTLQALCKVIDVVFYASKVGVEEVANEADRVLHGDADSLDVRAPQLSV